MKRSLFLLFLFCCCNKEKPAPAVDHLQVFTAVYQDYLIQITGDSNRTEFREKQLNRILNQHGMSRRSFDSLTIYLESHPALFEKIISQTANRLQQKITALDSTRTN